MLFKQSAQQSAFFHQEHQQVDQARWEAEALFRPKPKVVESSTRSEGPPADASARKPRILSAAPPLPAAETAGVSIQQERRPALSVLQPADTDRERLNRAREAIFAQQRELQAKLEALDTELRAIAAYEAAKQDKGSSHRPGP